MNRDVELRDVLASDMDVTVVGRLAWITVDTEDYGVVLIQIDVDELDAFADMVKGILGPPPACPHTTVGLLGTALECVKPVGHDRHHRAADGTTWEALVAA